MKLHGRSLLAGSNGEDVALLHRELAQLGFTIQANEIQAQFYGPETAGAVRQFQQQSRIQPTGIVDEATAAAIKTAVPPGPVQDISEYRQLVTDVGPVLEARAPADLTDADLTFLAGEVGSPRDRLQLWRTAEQLGRKASLSPQLFYGLARERFPATLDELAALDADRVRAGVEASVADRFVDAGTGAVVDALIALLRARRAAALSQDILPRVATLRLLDARTGRPAAAAPVRVIDLEARGGPRSMGIYVTSDNGQFDVAYAARRPGVGTDIPAARPVRVELVDEGGNDNPASADVNLPDATDGQPLVIDVRIAGALRADLASAQLDAVIAAGDRPLPAEVRTAIVQLGARTLADLRRDGGLAVPANATPNVAAAVLWLNAHATLELLSPNIATNEQLFGMGYAGPGDIALAGRTSFMASAHEVLGDYAASEMHAAATGMLHFGDAVDSAAWSDPELSSRPAGPGGEERCGCDECHVATSPLAYLADLLRYTLQHVAVDHTALSLTDLETKLFQPFGTLPDSCDSMQRVVLQARLAIEVLHRYLAMHPPGPADAAQLAEASAQYLRAAYRALLVRLGTSEEELRLAPGTNEPQRAALAARLGVPLTRPRPAGGDELDELTLAPAALTEERLEQLFGLARTTPEAPAPATPRIETLRLAYLHATWAHQDWPADDYAPDASALAPPVVDPDLVGPDDFRLAPDGANPAFDLWRARRAQLDTILAALRAKVPKLRTGLPAALDAEIAADTMATIATLTALVDQLVRATRAEADSATAALAKLGLSAEGARRLMELRVKHALARPGTAHPPLTAADWADLVGILAQARKSALFGAWRAEEGAKGIAIGPALFWPARREPAEGEWPPLAADGSVIDAAPIPMIDPDLVRLPELPESSIGSRAAAYWRSRRTQLDALAAKLSALRADHGLDAVFADVLGAGVDLDLLDTQLANGDPALDAALAALSLTVDDLRLLTAFRRRETAGPGTGPGSTQAEWNLVVGILTGVRKRKSLYAAWLAEERGPTPDKRLRYWEARRAMLPPWRASGEARQRWRLALRHRSERPNVDPDLLRPEDFAAPAAGNAAFDMYGARTVTVAAWLGALTSAESRAAGLRSVAARELGLAAADLDALFKADASGDDVSARVGQLDLSMEAFRRITRLDALAVTPASLEPQQWEELANILVQVRKTRAFGAWREEEQIQSVFLAPPHFTVPDNATRAARAAHPVHVSPWRAPLEARMAWDDTLGARVEQEHNVRSGILEAVSAAEGQTLGHLRDALIDATNAPGLAADPDAKATWLTRRLFIDMKAGLCQRITRAGQAIETLQALLVVARSGVVSTPGDPATPALLRLSALPPIPDDEWKWIGSYATWRAAMFAFLYPENLVVPSLRPLQTDPFRELVAALRSGQPVSPTAACRAATRYREYFADVCTLSIDATCQVMTTLPTGASCAVGGSSEAADAVALKGKARALVHMVARARASGRIYWATYDPAGHGPQRMTFWERVPALESLGAPQVVGAVAYAPSTGGRFLYVFVMGTEKDARKLYYTRYDLEHDLEQARWDGPPAKPLDVPDHPSFTTGALEVRLEQSRSESEPPRLVFRHGRLYMREIDPTGVRWVERTASAEGGASPDPWVAYLHDGRVWNWNRGDDADYLSGVVAQLHAVAPIRTSTSKLQLYCYTDKLGLLCVAKSYAYGPNTTSFGHSTFLGMFNSTGGTQLFFRADDVDGRVYQAVFNWDEWALIRNHDRRQSPDQDIDRIGVATVVQRPETVDFFVAVHRVTDAAPHLVACQGATYSLQVRELVCLAPTMVDPSLEVLPSAVYDTVAAKCPLGLIYLQEVYYFVPVYVALQLQARYYYDEALASWRQVYDFTLPPAQRKRYPGLKREASLAAGFKRPENWLRDPLNPHAVAQTRRYSYTRYTLLAIIRCLLGYADAEFTRDTVESLPRARMLYQQVLDLHGANELRTRLNSCADVIGEMRFDVPEVWMPMAMSLTRDLARLPDIRSVTDTRDAVIDALAAPGDAATRIERARVAIADALRAQPAPSPLGRSIEEDARARKIWTLSMLRNPGAVEGAAAAVKAAIEEHLMAVAAASGLTPATLREEPPDLPWLRDPMPVGPAYLSRDGAAIAVEGLTTPDVPVLASRQFRTMSGAWDGGYTPHVSFTTCIAPNPVIDALRQRAALNLHKLRNCRNIAGMQRQLDLYAAPTDLSSGMPLIGADGVLMLPGTAVLRPTQYRYAPLAERAKQLVALAQQAESAMLNALERGDAEAFTLLQARQQLSVARAGVQLQTLRVRTAEDSVILAESQQQRAQLQEKHYQQLLDAGWKFEETAQIIMLFGAMAAEIAAAEAKASTGIGAADALQATASALQIGATIAAMFASHERQVEEWQFQHSLAMQDATIGAQQVTVSRDNVQVAGQERQIAQLQADHAEASVEFLANKFTRVDLYDWMSGVLRQVYSYFLQQATALAKLAAMQLAYEQQEPPPLVIQDDYWSVGSNDVIRIPGRDNQPDRSGLTGSARLLKDLYQLDQYAFETNRRKLQLTKTLSLAHHAPLEFEQFRQTGVMLFATPMEMFDREFPGHYLRTLRRVRTSVIALVPPAQGIRATLSCLGTSRVTIGGDVFQTVPIWHGPQSVALSSPRDATGIFELDMQPELVLPFEGIGVDTNWELRMPKPANPFSYDTLADMLITLDYTALDSADYRDQVLQTLRPTVYGERPFSFRHQFADQWYDLHNPDQSATPMVVRFGTTRADFPPNLDNVRIGHLLLYFARAGMDVFEVPVTALRVDNEGGEGFVGGGAVSVDGVISTRRGNGGGWTPILGRPVAGEWELKLPDTYEVRGWFRDERITDILFDVTYSGRTQPWPA